MLFHRLRTAAPQRRFASFRPGVVLTALGSACLLAAGCWAGNTAPKPTPTTVKVSRPRYQYRQFHDPNGTGKFYMGREIAQVMGHEGADWLDRPEREAEEAPNLLLDALRLKPGDVVADVGAGSGYLTFRMAPRVGPTGSVLAVDIQQEMLDLIIERGKAQGLTNVKPVLGTITDPKLPPESVDLILMVDVYHEFSHPWEMTRAMLRGLKPGGRLVFVEYRLEDPEVPIKLVHKMSEAQVKREMAIHPVTFVETSRVLPRQHIIVFRKK